MNSLHKVLAVSSLALGAQSFQAIAGVVNYDLPAQVGETDGPFNIFVPVSPSIPNADAFLSIDNGSISGHEGASFTIVADFVDTPDVLIYQHVFSGGDVATFNFDDVPLTSFDMGELSGLWFTATSPGSPTFIFNFILPEDTTFSFSQVSIPEPAATPFYMGAAAAGIYALRRRRETKTLA